MKIWRIVLTMAAVLVSASCNSERNRTIKYERMDCADAQTTSIGDKAKSGAYIEVEKQEMPMSTEAIEVKIVNNADADIEFGDVYYIEKWEADKWSRLALDKDTLGRAIAFNLIGYSLTPNAFTRKTYNLLKCAYRYSAGKYRIVIPYTKNGIDMKMSSEFTLVKDSKFNSSKSLKL